MLPIVKDVDALRASADRDIGGIGVARIFPAKYVWDTLLDLHAYLGDIIPEAERTSGPRGLPSPGTVLTPEEASAVKDPDAVFTAPPFPDAGGPIGTGDDS